MRRNRLIAAGFAAAVTLGLLAVAQPGNANTETDNKITADGDLVLFAVQSRAPNIDDEEVDGNALSIFNAGTTTVNLNGWMVEVVDGAGATTATHSFTVSTPLLAKQHYILHTTGFLVNPIDGQAQSAPFSGQSGSDEIPQVYEVTLTSATPTEIDRVASADTDDITPEGNNPAPQLIEATDKFNAFVRRDVLGTDLNNNAVDFAIMPAIWGTQLS